ncbi:MAG: GtrA family protein [Propionicimonas sp.]|uniref:GtrA family protein n=1 Tax=Propionicimonas sp. TaxID=1955623 RepID=UPI003D124C0D
MSEAPIADEATPKLALRTQLVRFVVTGGLSAVVDFGLLVVLMNLAGLEHTPAKALSFVAGTTTAYLINRRWTFQADPSKRRFAAVVLLYGLTFVLQVGLFAVLYPWVLAVSGSQTAAQVVGFVIAQGVATTVNFIVQRGLIFR